MNSNQNLTAGEFKSLILVQLDSNNFDHEMASEVDMLIGNLIDFFTDGYPDIENDVPNEQIINVCHIDLDHFINSAKFQEGILDNTFGFMAHSIDNNDALVRSTLITLYAIKEKMLTNDSHIFNFNTKADVHQILQLAEIYTAMNLGVTRTIVLGAYKTSVSSSYPYESLNQEKLQSLPNRKGADTIDWATNQLQTLVEEINIG